MLDHTGHQAGGDEAHHPGVDEVPECIDEGIHARGQPAGVGIDDDVAAAGLAVGQEAEDGDCRRDT